MAIHKIFTPKYETLSREELEALQLRRLQDTVMRVYSRVPFYRRKMDALQEHITTRIHSVLGIGARVTLVEPKTIERSMGKAKRVIDKRNIT